MRALHPVNNTLTFGIRGIGRPGPANRNASIGGKAAQFVRHYWLDVLLHKNYTKIMALPDLDLSQLLVSKVQ
jgi:hypothetical protein